MIGLIIQIKKTYVFDDNGIGGLLVLKNNPQKDYVKIATLLVINGYQQRGIGNMLLDEAIKFTISSGKNKLSVTVSEDIISSLDFFKKEFI